MAISIDSNPTQLSACDATTGWTGGDGQLLVDTAVYQEGSGSLSDWVNATTQSLVSYAIGSSTDMSNGEHIYCWMYCSGVVDTQANGGYRIYASDGTNNATWYVGGNDTHGTGWQLMAVSVDATPDISSGTLDTSAITIVGVAFKTLTIAVKKGQTFINNCYWDNIQYGNGLTITSGATDQITMEDIYAADATTSTRWGVVQKSNGAYIVNGKLTFGDTGTSSIDMVMDGEVILYPDNDYVSNNFSTIELLGNATGTSDLEIKGSFIKANNVAGKLDLSGSNLDTVSLVGNSFVNMGACDFNASQTITNNVLDGCGLISPSTCTFTSNTVKNSTETASYALFMPATHNISKTSYSNNFWGFGVTPATSGASYSEDGGTFTGNTADVRNTHATNAVTINAVNGSDVSTSSTAGGVVTINNAVAITVTVLDDSTGLPIEDASIQVLNASTKATIISGRTLSTGIYTDSINYTGDIAFVGWARQMDLSGTDYTAKDFSGTITTAGASVNVRLVPII